MDLGLAGKTALVTGGSRGIGRAIARQLALEGVDVAICARGKEALARTANELQEETGRRFAWFVADAARSEDAKATAESATSALGRLDILVNNAGYPGGLAQGPLPQVDPNALLEDLNMKTVGYLRFAQACAPEMQKRGWGRIINIGGISARQSGSYSAGMRNIAIAHLTRTLSSELGASGITVNLIHPGLTRTERTADDQGAEMARNVIGRVVDAQEIAVLATFLASPLAGAITGEVIGIGGGEPRRSIIL